ncbi:hypothetical protein MKX01_018935 [Papaver californicum]|nr:hypothetical protein MKX01_018935 [Papaver californicum]
MAAKPAEEEEAVMLKTLAEKKYKESEIESALEYARKAKSLNQNLDGISELVTTYSVLHEASLSSPPNWYKILQVESFSHINIIKKQYRKLALTLHPDKNPSCLASEEAFKHVSEAFRLLSDKIRKKDFDVKLRISVQSAALSSNGTHDDDGAADMFATKCLSCKLVHQFERRKFIGQSLVFPRCKKSFVAEEMRVNDDETRVMVYKSRRKRKATITDFLDRIGLKSKQPKKKVKFADEMTLSEMQMEAKRKNEEEMTVVAISERSSDLEAMLVEDSDFYSFDKDRSECCFKKCQIWAAYGDSDGMPRHYGLVDEIIPLNAFKVKVSWLALQGKGDNVASLEGSDCQISCGKFKVDGKTVVNSVNIFSHIVECERVAREIYMIYPKKGSVWALYGGSDSLNVVNGCYDIVVILTNYSEMTHGLSVAYLDKVKWFKTIFERREIGCHAVRWLEKDNVRLFSHQIPSRKLLGTEAPGLPKDCWELDPAALPQDLLVVEKDYLQQLDIS